MRTFIRFSLGLAALMAVACNSKKVEILPVCGTIDGPVTEENAPLKVHDAMTLDHADRYENILEDRDQDISVWSLYQCDPDLSSDGYGIQVIRDEKISCFPDIYHGNNPSARYDEASGNLWLFCGVMEGTGVHVERPYLIHFDDDAFAQVITTLGPYEVQQALLKRLGYSIKEDDITIYDNGHPLFTVTNSILDMGEFDNEKPIWIGEQMSYDLYGDGLYLTFVPGVKFIEGPVLLYDDMPELSAKITLSDDGTFNIGKIEL